MLQYFSGVVTGLVLSIHPEYLETIFAFTEGFLRELTTK